MLFRCIIEYTQYLDRYEVVYFAIHVFGCPVMTMCAFHREGKVGLRGSICAFCPRLVANNHLMVDEQKLTVDSEHR